MGGHHKPEPFKIPDWRIFKVEEVPELVQLRKALAQHGLCDPWLRNEVWRFKVKHPKYHMLKMTTYILSHGFKYGLVAAIITAGIEYAFFPLRKAPSEEENGHH